MQTFTLDTNCLIDVDESRPASTHILDLVAAHKTGIADVAVVAQSASERTKDGFYSENYSEFENRLTRLGMSELNEIYTLAYFDISFWGRALLASEYAMSRERQIHEVLFSNQPFEPPDRMMDGESEFSKSYVKWRNRKCDTLIYWAHDNANRDVFVTRDANFKRLEMSDAFPSAVVRTPDEAVAMLT